MKKARILLTAIAVVGTIGGALAFKANRSLSRLFYLTSTADAGPRKTVTATSINAGLGVYSIVGAPNAIFYTTTATAVTTTVPAFVAPAGY